MVHGPWTKNECRMKKWKDGRVEQWNVGRKEIGNHESRIMNPGGRRIDLWKFLSENKPKEINCIRSCEKKETAYSNFG
jgi:hypothetical protein